MEIGAIIAAVLGSGAVASLVTHLFKNNRERHEVWAIERNNLHADIEFLRSQYDSLRQEIEDLRKELHQNQNAANSILNARDRVYWDVYKLVKGDGDCETVRVEVERLIDGLQEVVGKRV